ncbi:MAG: PAS domain S-box protein [Nitrosomonadales bacterium]|nr:PAS domain S-box protein [Nitrosomonadales bacterium]
MRDPGDAADTSHSDILKIVLIYAVLAGLWILLSDQITEWVFTDATLLHIAQTLKGWLFVGVTSILLYFLLDKSSRRSGRPNKPGRHSGLVNWKPWWLYLFAATTTLFILLIRQHIAISSGERPLLILFMLPIILSAALGGLGPGLTSTAIAALAVAYFAIPPVGNFGIEHSYDLYQLLFLVAEGVLVSYLSEMLHEARYRSETERHNAEANLAEKTRAMELLDAIAEGSTDATFAQDLQGRYILLNRAAARFIGKTTRELLGQSAADIFPREQELSTKDGSTFFLTTKGPIHDEAGKVIGLFGIARDITGIKTTEEAFKRERDRNQRYLDSVQNIMIALDTEGRIGMINRYGCELLGYRESELLGKDWFKTCLPQPEGIEILLPVFRRILAGDLKDTQHYENAVVCRDGSRRMISWRNNYFKNEVGNIVGTLSSGEDITERKSAEAALLRQTEEVRLRNEELERFNRASVGRELDMISLKQQINELSRQLGKEPPYPLAFLDTSTGSHRGDETP